MNDGITIRGLAVMYIMMYMMMAVGDRNTAIILIFPFFKYVQAIFGSWGLSAEYVCSS